MLLVWNLEAMTCGKSFLVHLCFLLANLGIPSADEDAESMTWSVIAVCGLCLEFFCRGGDEVSLAAA